jgi:hypothetical protein
VNPDRSSPVAATLVGVGIALMTAAAQELGAPRFVWVGAAIAGGLTFAAALVLYVVQGKRPIPGEEPLPGGLRLPSGRRSSPLRWLLAQQREFAAAIALVGLLGTGAYAATKIDLPTSRESAVIVCIDSGSSTLRVRKGYLRDLSGVVLRAASEQTRFYAADCGFNATGTVDWPVKRKFAHHFGGSLGRNEALDQAEHVFSQGILRLVRSGSGAGPSSVGEVLSVMARQCEQAGGNCTLYFFTDADWNDDQLRVGDGIGIGERREYLRTYRPQLEGLAGSRVNFVGVGLGTSMGGKRLNEAHKLAQTLVEDAGGKLGAWTARL